MSFTIHDTLKSRVEQTTRRPLSSHESSIQQRIAALLKKMEACRLLSKEVSKQMPEYFQDLSTEEIKEEASLALCFLLCDCVHPAFLSVFSREEQDQLLDLEKTLRELLALTIPKGKTLEEWIEEYENFGDEQVVFKEKIEKIEACFQRQLEQLYQSANEVNNELMVSFNALKQNLLDLNRKRKAGTNEMHERLDILTEKVNQLSKDLTVSVKDSQSLANGIERQQKSFHQIVKQGQDVLKKVNLN